MIFLSVLFNTICDFVTFYYSYNESNRTICISVSWLLQLEDTETYTDEHVTIALIWPSRKSVELCTTFDLFNI